MTEEWVLPYTALDGGKQVSRLAPLRLLSNPVVYQLVLLLEEGGPLTPSRLAKYAGRSIQTVSGHLAKLRATDLVRYDSKGKEVHYWLKYKRETSELLKALEKVVHASSKLR